MILVFFDDAHLPSASPAMSRRHWTYVRGSAEGIVGNTTQCFRQASLCRDLAGIKGARIPQHDMQHRTRSMIGERGFEGRLMHMVESRLRRGCLCDQLGETSGASLNFALLHRLNTARPSVITANYVNLPPIYLVDWTEHRCKIYHLPVYLAVYHLPQSTSRW